MRGGTHLPGPHRLQQLLQAKQNGLLPDVLPVAGELFSNALSLFATALQPSDEYGAYRFSAVPPSGPAMPVTAKAKSAELCASTPAAISLAVSALTAP